VSPDWDALLARLRATRQGGALAAEAKLVALGVLAAPVAVARWIVERAPGLAERASLLLLVVGAEKLDAVDGGRWHQLIPTLLGRALTLQVTLVGEQLDAKFNSPAYAGAPAPAAHCHVGSLASFLGSADPRAFDVAFVFHPGLQKHQGWLRDSSLARLIGAGVPLIASSYEHDEYEMDRWVAECHGFSVAGEALLNPFFLEFSEGGALVRWGRALWQFGAKIPAPGAAVDSERLAALEQLARMVMHTIALGNRPSSSYGATVEARASDGASRKLIYLFDDYFVDPAAAAVLVLRTGQLEAIASLPAEDLSACPGPDASDLERAVWAAGIKARHLMHLYPSFAEEQARQMLARSMHASLESKVDGLFRTD